MKEHGTWLHWLYTLHILPEWVPEMVPVTILVIFVISIMAFLSSRNLVTKKPGRYQAFLEFIVTSLEGFVHNIVGDEAKSLTPFIGTLFIYILIMNYLGAIPGLLSPTANINTTASLAIIAFCMVQFYGFKKQGFKYLKHFLGEPLWLSPLMLPIHIIGELAKPLSLTIRLLGNIYGEDMVVLVLIQIVIMNMGKFLVPIQFPMLLFAMFTGFVQALVFAMLVSIYITVAISSHEEH